MSYLRTFFITFLALSILVSGINWFVDPYGIYWSPVVKGLNSQKLEASNRVRTIKPMRVKQVSPATVLIGNSRIEMGIAAESKKFVQQPVYNLGMPGIGLKSQFSLAFEQLQNNDNLQTVLFSLDYLDFLFSVKKLDGAYAKRTRNEVRETKRKAYLKQGSDLFSALLSLETLLSSMKTLIMQGSNSNHISESGTNIAGGYLAIMHTEGVKPLFEKKLQEVSGALSNQGYALFTDMLEYNPGFTWLDTFIRAAEEKGVEVKFFINPYHYSYLHLIQSTGHWNNFLTWKLALREIILATDKAEFWDFSGFNDYTTEFVDLENPHTGLNWYWEPAHYKSELGELMLESLLYGKAVPAFGYNMRTINLLSYKSDHQDGLQKTRNAWFKLQQGLGI